MFCRGGLSQRLLSGTFADKNPSSTTFTLSFVAGIINNKWAAKARIV